ENDGRRRDPCELSLKAIPQGGDASGLLRQRLLGGRGGCTEARNRRNGLRAGTETPLLPAAADQRVGEMLGLGANDERTGSLWAAELVAGKAEKIGTQVLDRDGDAAGRLNRVDVQQPPCPMDHFGSVLNRLYDSALVVCEHDRRQKATSGAGKLG